MEIRPEPARKPLPRHASVGATVDPLGAVPRDVAPLLRAGPGVPLVTRALAGVGLLLAAVAGWSAVTSASSESSSAAASHGAQLLYADGEENPRGLLDSDQDMIPDEAEWVLLSDPMSADSDGDGVDDLIEALEHESLVSGNNPGRPATNAFRVIVNTTAGSNPTGRNFWVHFLYRLPSGNIQDLQATILLFRTDEGRDLDLTSLLATPLVREVESRIDAKHGLLQRVSLCLPEPPGFSTLSPCSFRGYTLMNQEIIGSGMPLFFLGGAYHVLTHMSQTEAVLQTSGQNEITNPFWSAQKACVLKVDVQAYGPLGILCEITSADCVTAQTPSCTSSCKDSLGLMFTFPDALSLILGG